ncbi:MAG: 7-cyano-7-deazaguanine synthase [Nitrososphaerota archaeon]|nr:7-cyano-7-deazaguanine synthase [Nitrososphaerota archaeon]
MLLSGGIDSATALYMVRREYSVRALTFEYHGIARQELRASESIASRAGVSEHRLVRVPDLREAGDIPGGHFGGLPPTYIPLRNSVFYSFAASYGEEVGASVLVGGHNRDDLEVFRDVTPRFFSSLERAFRAASPILDKNRLRIVRPLGRMTKPKVISLASSLGVPLERTWSCHGDGKAHCWKCDGCLARRRSFAEVGVPDPLSPDRGKIT